MTGDAGGTPIRMVLAIGPRNEFGRGGGLPWPRLPRDMARLRDVTAGCALVMGRRTHASIGRVLPGRPNVVVSGSPAGLLAGTMHAPDFCTALRIASGLGRPAAVIGGVRLLMAAAGHPRLEAAYLTRVFREYPADVTLPTLALPGLRSCAMSGWHRTPGGPEPPYRFANLCRDPAFAGVTDLAPVAECEGRAFRCWFDPEARPRGART